MCVGTHVLPRVQVSILVCMSVHIHMYVCMREGLRMVGDRERESKRVEVCGGWYYI